MIGILNYGLGNIKAFLYIYKNLGIDVCIIDNNEDFAKINKLILPGVGTFDNAIQKLKKSNLYNNLEEYVINKKVPILGVCVGMQIMANTSEEGECKGLGWISGEVKKFTKLDNYSSFRLPHMGWNNIKVTEKNCKLFNGIDNPEFYFLHSYYYLLKDKKYSISKTNYTIEFSSAICKDNIFATQFHPEKSHHNGVILLKNFSEI